MFQKWLLGYAMILNFQTRFFVIKFLWLEIQVVTMLFELGQQRKKLMAFGVFQAATVLFME